MNRKPFFLVVALMGGLAGCSGCDTTAGLVDARAPDAGPDVGRADAPPPAPDVFPGHLPDTAVDTYPDITCGGSRTLTPQPVVRGKGRDCGNGCRQVTFGAEANLVYEVKDNILAYAGGGDAIRAAVYMVDLKADKEWRIQGRPHWRPGCPDVSTDGKRLAYGCIIDPDPNSADATTPLQIYDPATKVEKDVKCFHITTTIGYRPDDITMGSTGVATMMTLDRPQGQVDTFFYQFSDGSFSNLSKKYGGALNPHMSGTRVVWTEVMNGTTQIVVYDTATGTKTVPDPTGKPQFIARIEGDKIVWVDHRNAPGDMWHQGNSDIYLHDLSTGKTVPVTTQAAMQSFPDVWGDWVVWEDWRENPNPTPGLTGQNVDSAIYARNMKTTQEIKLTNLKGMEIRPHIDQKRVFFVAIGANQKTAIFMIDLAKLGY